jgi:hypothetical protein
VIFHTIQARFNKTVESLQTKLKLLWLYSILVKVLARQEERRKNPPTGRRPNGKGRAKNHGSKTRAPRKCHENNMRSNTVPRYKRPPQRETAIPLIAS